MKNYLFVGTMILIIGIFLLGYNSCTRPGLQLGGTGLQLGVPITQTVIDAIKPKPTTHTDTTTTTVTKPDGTVVTTIEDHSTINPPRLYRLDIGAAMPLDRKKELTLYDVSFNKQWMDHAWLGVVGYFQDSKMTHYGIRIGIEF